MIIDGILIPPLDCHIEILKVSRRNSCHKTGISQTSGRNLLQNILDVVVLRKLENLQAFTLDDNFEHHGTAGLVVPRNLSSA